MSLGTIEKVEITYANLTIADRCDASECSAQAFVLVEVPVQSSDLPLDVRYCGHHFNKHSAGLAGKGARVVYDNRHLINSKPTSPQDHEV